MTYRKFLLTVTLTAFALFLGVSFGSVKWLAPVLDDKTLGSMLGITMVLVFVGVILNLIPFLSAGLIIGPLHGLIIAPLLELFTSIPMVCALYFFYIMGLTHLLMRKYFPQAPFAHPLGLPGIKKRFLLLFSLMVLMGLGWIGLSSE